MRKALLLISLAIVLGGCVTTGGSGTGGSSGPLDGRVARIESRLNGSEDPTARPALRRPIENRLDDLYREVNQLNATLEEINRGVAATNRSTAALETEVTRLRGRFDALEAGRVGPGASDQQIRAMRTDLERQINVVQQKAEQAEAAASQTNQRLTSIQRDLQQKLNFFDNEIRNLYRDIMNGLGSSRPEGDVHVVERGETLGGIAAKYGLTVQALMRANPQITDPSLIQVGQKITIP